MYILESSELIKVCGDYGLASMLSVVQRVMGMIQIVVPICLLVGATLMFVKMMLNPEEKKHTKAIINCVLASLIVIFLPMIVNITMGWLDDSFNVTACWNVASQTEEMIEWQTGDSAGTSEKEKDIPGNRVDDYQFSK